MPVVSDDDLARAIDAEAGWIEDLTCRLVEIPSTLGNEEPAQVIVESALRDLGLEPVDVPMDADTLRAHPLAAPFSWDVTGKRNVAATWSAGGEGGRSLALNGHVDVVPPAAAELWTGDPFTPVRDGEWLVGRGAGDMKSGVAAMLGAVRALRGLGLAPLGDLQLQSVVEEECGGNGALQCVLALPTVDACVIPEPFPDSISVAQVGVLWFHVELAGVPVHVGEAGEGVNAIEATFPVIGRLRALETELNESPPPPFDSVAHPINLNIGVIRGGDWVSTVAASCTLSCRLAVFPGQADRVAEDCASRRRWPRRVAITPGSPSTRPRALRRVRGQRCRGLERAPRSSSRSRPPTSLRRESNRRGSRPPRRPTPGLRGEWHPSRLSRAAPRQCTVSTNGSTFPSVIKTARTLGHCS